MQSYLVRYTDTAQHIRYALAYGKLEGIETAVRQHIAGVQTISAIIAVSTLDTPLEIVPEGSIELAGD